MQSTVRTIYSATVEREQPEVIRIRIRGNGFLYNMVRILVGTLLGVNEGRYAVSELDAILASRDRLRAGMTAQPHGLSLYRVFYD